MHDSVDRINFLMKQQNSKCSFHSVVTLVCCLEKTGLIWRYGCLDDLLLPILNIFVILS